MSYFLLKQTSYVPRLNDDLLRLKLTSFQGNNVGKSLKTLVSITKCLQTTFCQVVKIDFVKIMFWAENQTNEGFHEKMVEKMVKMIQVKFKLRTKLTQCFQVGKCSKCINHINETNHST